MLHTTSYLFYDERAKSSHKRRRIINYFNRSVVLKKKKKKKVNTIPGKGGFATLEKEKKKLGRSD